ncbi:MAG: NADH:ubiquinone reductase (Na(+)-transporting) subunit D [Bacteroidales bacterium]|jgi:Na+-transporting NADH:ubiquinone oxidoreductase subunit D|nr:NADH:ubiquinone reductase (Na(+)-transporting) subunit D [Bacteroidales bacterium]
MEKQNKEPIFSTKNIRLLKNPFNKENPITVQVLGICSALAVTAKMQPAFVMAISVTVVVAMSNLICSMLRNTIPPRIRIIVQLVIVSLLVILVDQLLKAFVYEISKQLSVFVSLIVTNCIVMGRIEAFALNNKSFPSFLDGIGNGLGYGMILMVVSFIRELFGSGSLWGYKVIPQWFYEHGYANNSLMIMPPMALIVVGLIVWFHRSRNKDLCE